MRESYKKGVANHLGLESCVRSREAGNANSNRLGFIRQSTFVHKKPKAITIELLDLRQERELAGVNLCFCFIHTDHSIYSPD